MKEDMKRDIKKDLTEIVFILDRSGSMQGLEKDTIGGFNSMIEKQKEGKGDANVTTILFDDNIEFLHKRVNIKKINHITNKDYYVRGCTALLDAIGNGINYMVNVQRYQSEDEKAKNVLFIITTDGYENASREFTYKKINEMISYEKEKYNWEFLFLGANIDAISTANNFGISKDHAVDYICDNIGTEKTYRAFNNVISSLRMGEKIESDWKEEIEMDFLKRTKRKGKKSQKNK